MTGSVILVDYENLYFYLHNKTQAPPHEAIVGLLRTLRDVIQRDYERPVRSMAAYGDFERIPGIQFGALYLLGVNAQYVMGSDRKNSTDMQLAIDALDVLYTRPEVDLFVIASGDRDFIPLVRHLLERGKRILIVSFRGALAGDLTAVVGKENVIDALTLVNSDIQSLASLEPEIHLTVFDPKTGLEDIHPIPVPADPASTPQPSPVPVTPELTPEKDPPPTPVPVTPAPTPEKDPPPAPRPLVPPAPVPVQKATVPTFKPIQALTREEQDFLEALLTHFSHYPEIWVSPALNKMRSEFYTWTEYQRSQTLNALDRKGALAIYVRPSDNGIAYNVAKINWNHPAVQECNPG